VLKRITFVVVLMVGLAVATATPGFTSGLSQTVDDRDTIVLSGNVHPLARPEFDAGAVELSLPMERMILALRVAPEKQAALDQLLAEQQDPNSPNFHRWLTPEEYGERFGPSQEAVDMVTDWLTSEGFVIEEVGKGRTWINFSGVVADVERAFHTQIHHYYVDGVLRQGNAWAPAIPRALSHLVAGVVSLHNFPRPALNAGIRPAYTGSGGSHAISPGDFAIIYDVNTLYSAGYDGTGRTIGIVARTHPASSNWTTFRSTMGLSSTIAQVIVNGTDPGDLGSDEDGEADLDCEWSGGVAKGASVKFVVSASTGSTDGVDLSAQYIVNNNLTDVMSTSFGQCESSMGSTENTFYNNLWSQAASEGITSFVSTGDSGAAGCNGGSDTSGSGGLAVSGLASTPYNVAVGGTEFNDPTASTYWNTSNSTGDVSAKSYIPEIAWNESGAATTCPSGDTCSGLWSSSGGASTIYTKPSWQVCTGVPTANHRYIPDWSFTAASHDGYLVETQGALYLIGGTSASSPSSAGVMALICQKTGSRQGNANTRIYQLANAQYASGGAVIFHDTTSGNNSVPGLTGFSCTTGYDEVTGVGSVDVGALANNWAASTPDFSISASPTSVSAAQGASGTTTITTTVLGGFSNAISLSASGLPTGATATFNPTSIAAPGSGTSTLTLTAGASTATGTYTVTVTGTGGSTTHTTTVSFTVTAAATPDFTILASPTSVSAVQGSFGTTTVTTAVSGGFNNAISLSASGLPTGATAAFSPTSIAAPGSGSSTLTLTAGASTATGTYTVTITGTGGSKTHTATVSFTVTASGGGTTLFSDGFEGTGWSTVQVSGTAGAWTLVSSSSHPSISAHGGSKWADFNSYTSASGSQTRVYRSSGFAVGNYGTVTLTFWMYHDTGYSSDADKVQAQVSTNGTTWTNVGSAVSRYTGSTGWAQVSVDISSYQGSSSLQLGFLGISAYGDDEYIDDVSVVASGTPPATYTVSGTITYNSSGLSGVTVSTTGASTTTNSSGAYTLSGLANGTYTVTPALSGYTFSPTSRSVTVNGANVTGINFTAASGGGPTTLFSDGFEGTGWSTAQVSGTAGKWTLVSSSSHPSISAHGGSKWADFNSYTAASGNQTRIYQSAGFAVPSSYTTVTLTFWMYHDTGYSTYADKVQAQVSTNGTTWTNVGAAVSRYTGSTGWAQVTIDLSSYKGQTVFLGFVGISAYGNDEYLDDVMVTAQ